MRNYRLKGVAVAVAALAALVRGASAGAQNGLESPASAAQRLQQATGGNVSIRWSNAGVARFVRARGHDDPGVDRSDDARRQGAGVLRPVGALFGVQSPQAELLSVGAASDESRGSASFGQRYRACRSSTPSWSSASTRPAGSPRSTARSFRASRSRPNRKSARAPRRPPRPARSRRSSASTRWDSRRPLPSSASTGPGSRLTASACRRSPGRRR